MTAHYHPPVKHSVEVAGHKTSISLEPVFWEALQASARDQGIPLSTLIARIDAERLKAQRPPGLAGALRLYVFNRAGRAPQRAQ